MDTLKHRALRRGNLRVEEVLVLIIESGKLEVGKPRRMERILPNLSDGISENTFLFGDAYYYLEPAGTVDGILATMSHPICHCHIRYKQLFLRFKCYRWRASAWIPEFLIFPTFTLPRGALRYYYAVFYRPGGAT